MALAKGQSLASGPLPRDDSAGSPAPALENTESPAPAVNFAGDGGAAQDGGESMLPHGHPDVFVGVPGLPPGAREIFPRRSTYDGIPFRPVNPRGKGAIISERAEQARQSQVTIPHQPSAVQPRTSGDQQQKPQNAPDSTVEPQQHQQHQQPQQMPIQRQNQIQHLQLQKKQQLQKQAAQKQAAQLQQRQKHAQQQLQLQQQQQAQQPQAQQPQAQQLQQLQQQHKQQQQSLPDRDKIQQEALARQAHLRQQAQKKLLSTGQTPQHQPRNQQLLQQQDQQQPQQQGKPPTSAAVAATTADARLTDATKIAPAGTGASTGPHLTAGGYVRPSEDGAASAWQAQIKASHHAQTQAQVQALAKKLSQQAAAQAQALAAAPAKGQVPAPAQTHAPAQAQTALAQPQAPAQIQAHAQQLPVAQKQTPRAQHAIAAAAASPQGSSTMPPPRSVVQPPPASANVQQQQHRQQQHRQEQQSSFGGGAAAKAMPQMRPLHPVMVPPVEPEPKDAKLTGPMNGIRMAALMDEVDPEFTLHSDTEELLLALAQNHIEGVATAAVELARHRRSDIVEVQDLQLCLGKDWDMPWLGVGNPARSGSRNEVKSSRTKLNAAVAADRAKVASTANASARKRAQKRGRDASGGGGGGGGGVDIKKARPQAAEGIGTTGGAAVGGGAGAEINGESGGFDTESHISMGPQEKFNDSLTRCIRAELALQQVKATRRRGQEPGRNRKILKG